MQNDLCQQRSTVDPVFNVKNSYDISYKCILKIETSRTEFRLHI